MSCSLILFNVNSYALPFNARWVAFLDPVPQMSSALLFGVSLPIFPLLTKKEVDYIIDTVNNLPAINRVSG